MSDVSKMSNGPGRKRDPPCCSDDETSGAEDDTRDQSGSICQKTILHYKKVVRTRGQPEPLVFMDFPREVRNIIYHMTLTEPSGQLWITYDDCTRLCRSRAMLINLREEEASSPDYLKSRGMYATPTRNLALLRTSKTIHAEAGAILYGQKLIFNELPALQSFLGGISSSQLKLLRHVIYFSRGTSLHRALMPSVFALLAGADGLETLKADMKYIDRTSFRPGDGTFALNKISVADWDAVVARSMAAEVYRSLFIYLRLAVADRGLDKVMDVLKVFEYIFLNGPASACVRIPVQPKHVETVKWTEERKVAMKKAMGKEIERLLKQDET